MKKVMNNEELKKFLEQKLTIQRRIDIRIQEIKGYRERAEKTSVILTGLPKSSGYINKMEETIVYYVDMENKLWDEIEELNKLEERIIQLIGTVESIEHKILLELRYMNCKTMEQIAVELGYGVRHVYRLRDEAIKKIKQ